MAKPEYRGLQRSKPAPTEQKARDTELKDMARGATDPGLYPF